MRSLHPSVADADGSVEDPHDAQALEPLDAPHDVDQRVHRAHLVEGDLVRRYAVDLRLGLAQQGEGTHRPLTHPTGDRGALDHGDQLADVVMGPVGGAAVRVVAVRVVVVGGDGHMLILMRRHRLGWRLVRTVPKGHSDLRRPDAAAIYRVHRHGHVGNAQARREAAEPVGRSSGGHQRAEQHVAAHAGGRIEDGKTSISHRLINMAEAQVGGKPPESR